MKIFKLFTIAIMLLIFAIYSVGTASAQNTITPGPPLPVPVTINTDKQTYTFGETITVTGTVNRELIHTQDPLLIQFRNSSYAIIHGPDKLDENKNGSYIYHLNLEKSFGTTGKYSIEITHGNNTLDTITGFMFIAGPYDMMVGDKTYHINYKITSGQINKINTDTKSKSLDLYLNNTGLVTIMLPRNLIDAVYKNHDTNFTVLIGVHNQPDEYKKLGDFKEIQTNNEYRILIINIPYDVTNPSGLWDVEIVGTKLLSDSYITPLKQFESGTPAKSIACKDDLLLVIKSSSGSPACVKHDTANILIERGWARTSP